MTDTRPGWVRDAGFDREIVASMTPNEAMEYLTLLSRYFPVWQLPSLAWLRNASRGRRLHAPQDSGEAPAE
jgi:hypothetical protein